MSTSPKNPWPLGIAIVLIAFVAALVGFVIFASRRPSDLVTPDYYARELQHQSQIDRETRALALEGYTFAFSPADRRIALQFPGGPVRGAVLLYRSSAAALDRTVPLATDTNGAQVIDLSGCARGLWKVEVQWAQAGTEYYREHTLVIP